MFRFVAVAYLCTAIAGPAVSNPLVLVEAGQCRCAVVVPAGDELLLRTATRLAAFVDEQTGVRPPIVMDAQADALDQSTVLIALDATTNAHVVRRWGAKVTVTSDRDDAYRLKTVRSDGRDLIVAVGRASVGAKYAAYRLMREMRFEDGKAIVPPLDIQSGPFFKTRSVSLFNIWLFPVPVERRYNIESWPIEKIERYLDMYDFFGFNAIETHDRFNDRYMQPCYGLTRAEWRDKVHAMCKHAHEIGQKVFLRAWGNAVMDVPEDFHPETPTSKIPRESKLLCVQVPAERARWEREIRDYYAENYAGYIDHFIGHWSDPSGCRRKGCSCTIKTAMKLHMEIHDAFKQRDPNFESSFSLWWLARAKEREARPQGTTQGWRGYEDHRSVCDAGILAPEVIIAEHRSYSEEITRDIIDSGHRAAVWTWYRTDQEVRPSLHIHLQRRVGEYFASLPDSARDIEWHNIERNVHGAANVANLYVAGRLMWDPKADVYKTLREFVSLVFEPQNVGAVVAAYKAIEIVRCRAHTPDTRYPSDPLPYPTDPAAEWKIVDDALANLRTVKIDPAYHPRVPLIITPQQIVDDLTASLNVIRTYTNCLASDVPAIEQAIAAGEYDDATRRIDAFTPLGEKWYPTIEGWLEWVRLDRKCEQWREQIERAKAGDE